VIKYSFKKDYGKIQRLFDHGLVFHSYLTQISFEIPSSWLKSACHTSVLERWAFGHWSLVGRVERPNSWFVVAI